MEIIEYEKEINRKIHKKFYRNKSALNRSTIKDNISKKLGETQYNNFAKIYK